MSVIIAQPGETPGATESTDLIESFVGLAGSMRSGEHFTFFNAAAPDQRGCANHQGRDDDRQGLKPLWSVLQPAPLQFRLPFPLPR